ncbi:hypothetical protein SARC_10733 [Sphaeroforma arctica JP610]|uniref:Integrase catalytic domain-containing protein n=1 Tax=Sphaeroforma arctica JP610 TaxID=667725 RepID=A0A0L0FJ24_9EUKA|nr:hypothetical protein SARC_10733 [Sphaeroforma arctica JP610]KNC76784.1 hypothetical protein SARC_10733 [Sphaeroforma arctica JP610]|eukprot:XP_014150686.1 hypothetical protein SARC_10733 [Sphaeroforma arctica JP610]
MCVRVVTPAKRYLTTWGRQKGLLQQPTRPEEATREVSMDFMDFDLVNGQFKVLLAVDTQTRMIFARVFSPSGDGPSVVRFMEEKVLAWGSPARLVMDADKKFQNGDVATFCKRRIIVPHWITVDRHQGNGRPETLIRTMKDWLRREIEAADDSPHAWLHLVYEMVRI